jgi:hypothetical protein
MYAPTLRAKASEWEALQQLSPSIRRNISHIIEFVPDWKGPGSTQGKRKPRAPQTPLEYVIRFLESLAGATPSETTSFAYFDNAGKTGEWSGINLWNTFAQVIPSTTHVIPLVDLDSVSTSIGLGTALRLTDEVGLRLNSRHFDPTLGGQIAHAMQALRVDAATTHLIVDLRDRPGSAAHNQIRTMLQDADSFASIVVLAGVFPRDLTGYQPGVATEPRTEWTTWWSEHVATGSAQRMLAFGDFTTQCAYYAPAVEVPGSVSLRYTTDDGTVVFRGRQSNNLTGFGHEQMHGHCRLLVSRSDYDGASFSWGDARFNCWTDPSFGTGNAMQWRTASIVHHISHVVVQLHDPVGSTSTARAWARAQIAPACR